MAKIKFEFNCSSCGKYFDVKLNTSLNGNYRIHCPACNHIHYREIKNGKITDTRFTENDDKVLIEDIRPMKSSCRDFQKEKFDDIADTPKVAVETLRDMITESDFRKFLRFGFILVNAPSGKVYQIFRTASHTRVWRGGKVIEEICVRIKNKKIPLTDNLVAFKTMIEGDEEEFRRIGNVYKLEKVA